MRTPTVVGIVALVVVVWLAAAGAHVTVGTGPSPAPSVAATPIPTPTPAPDPFAPARWAAANVAVISLILAIGIGVPVGIALHARYRSKLLEPLNPPLRDRELAHRLYDVKSLEARRGWLPESFTFSPRYTNREVEVEEAATPALPLSGSIDDLLSHGHGLAYGWRVDNGQLLVDRQVRSLLVGGVQGSGKTSFVALLVAQLVRMNARVMLADPDALNPEGLASRLAGLGVQPEQTAQEPPAVLRLVLNAQHELMTRRDQGTYADGRPYVLVVDEVPEMLRVLNARDTGRLRDALELIGGLKGRKLGVAVVLLGQGWGQAVIGSTTMRDLVPAGAVFRMRTEQAERMCGIKPGYWRAVGPEPFDLQPGEFYVVGVDTGAVRVRVPALPIAPARAELPPTSPHFPGTSRALPPDPPEAVGKRSGSAPEVLPEAAVLRLLKQGHSIGAIVRELTGERGGRAFQQAHDEVLAIIRRQLPEEES